MDGIDFSFEFMLGHSSFSLRAPYRKIFARTATSIKNAIAVGYSGGAKRSPEELFTKGPSGNRISDKHIPYIIIRK